MRKFIKIFFFIFLISNVFGVFAEGCKFSGKIQRCDSELKAGGFIKSDGSFVTPGASLRSIEEFPCLQAAGEARVFQIAMDENFKEIDDEMKKYLANLEASKDLYFGPNAQFDYFDGLNLVREKTKEYKDKYFVACSQSLIDAATCIENMAYTNPEDRPSVSVLESMNYLHSNNGKNDGDCYKLAILKTNIFNQVAYNTLLLNKQQVARDDKKLYDQELRTKYDKVIDLMMINLSYIERIWKRWPEKLRHTYGS